MRPPASGPSIGPMSAGIATKLIARTSSDFAKVRTSVRRPTGHHHRAAAALEDAARDEQMEVARDAAEERAEREDADRRREDAARAEAIGDPAADRDEDREAQRVAREHRLHAERRDVERARHRWARPC